MAINSNIKYSLIIWCRFDMCIRLKKNYNECNPTKLILPNIKTINNKNLYMSYWDHLHSGYSDHWFFSNPDIMIKIANMYDILYDYYRINSDFDKFSQNLTKKYKNNGFRCNSHTIHMYYIYSQNLKKCFHL